MGVTILSIRLNQAVFSKGDRSTFLKKKKKNRWKGYPQPKCTSVRRKPSRLNPKHAGRSVVPWQILDGPHDGTGTPETENEIDEDVDQS